MSHRQPPQAPQTPARVVKIDGIAVSSSDKHVPTISTGGERLWVNLSELDSIAKVAAYANLQDLHLTMGAQYDALLG